MKAPQANFTQRTLVPEGNHLAICYEMIEIGTVEEDYMGQPKILPKVRVAWELPHETIEIDGVDKPLAIANEYTFSMGEKATLRKHLESWRGKKFTQDEADNFDIDKLLGVPCLLNVTHKESRNGKIYEVIQAITPLTKGMVAPKMHNAKNILSYDTFDINKFNALPDFIKTKMMSSVEYKEMFGKVDTNTPTESNPAVDSLKKAFDGISIEQAIVNDDLPF